MIDLDQRTNDDTQESSTDLTNITHDRNQTSEYNLVTIFFTSSLLIPVNRFHSIFPSGDSSFSSKDVFHSSSRVSLQRNEHSQQVHPFFRNLISSRFRQLFGPGPSTMPPIIGSSQAQPLLGHLHPEFVEVIQFTD